MVAEVNGEKIYLRSLENLLDSSMPAGAENPSYEDLKENYGRALKNLIIRALVRQELEARGIRVKDATWERAVAKLKEEYGEEEWQKFLDDANLSESDWRELSLDSASLKIFRDRALAPKIKIGAEEIRAYYKSKKSEFEIPASVTVCFLYAESDAGLKKVAERLVAGDFPEDGTQCLECPLADIPEEWQKEVRNAGPGDLLESRDAGGGRQSVYILARNEARRISMAEAFPFIENLLLEKEIRAAFDTWLAEKLKTSRIKIQPDLKAIILEEGTEASEATKKAGEEKNGTNSS